MGMVVQHNIQAANANRMLNITNGQQAKSTEKLSSGFKINRAADDAAGLSISEKMRKQIRGLDQASANAQDGISAVQTSEGALTEVHSMLQRMNELANKAANGTNSEDDRQSIQDEISQLTTEIDRVAETTKFNEIYLLKGNPDGSTHTKNVAAHDAGLAGALTDKGNGTTTFALNKALENGDKVSIAGSEYTIGNAGKGSPMERKDLNTKTDGYASAGAVASKTGFKAGDSITYEGNTYTLSQNVSVDSLDLSTAGYMFKIGNELYTVAAADNGNQVTASTAMSKIKDALAAGEQVTLVKGTVNARGSVTASEISAATINVVSELGKGEVSMYQISGATAGGNPGAALPDVLKAVLDDASVAGIKAGDSFVIGGKETKVTSADAVSARDMFDAISKDTAVVKGTKVTVGEGDSAKIYTVGDEDDESTYTFTKDTILSKIKDGDTVSLSVTTTAPVLTADKKYTVIGDIGSNNPGEEGVITKKAAYEMMKDELQKASSIGADTDASVKNNGDGTFAIKQGTVEVKNSLEFSLHVGADADMTNKINVKVDSMNAAGLGVKGLNVVDKTGASATYAIDAISDAIATVSKQRSALGAVQNRLEHTIANLDNISENTSAAESEIRDTDMAKEMVNHSKNSILAQAGQSMLAQANQSNQGVLSLLG